MFNSSLRSSLGFVLAASYLQPLLPEPSSVLLGINLVKVCLVIFVEAHEVLVPQQRVLLPNPGPPSEDPNKALLRSAQFVLRQAQQVAGGLAKTS